MITKQIFKTIAIILLFFPLLDLWSFEPSSHKYGVVLGPLSTASITSEIDAEEGALVVDSTLGVLKLYINGAWVAVGSTTPAASDTFVLNFGDANLAADVYTLIGGNTYTPGSADAILWRNGLVQRVGTDYLETNSTSLTMQDYTANSGDLYSFRRFDTDTADFRQDFTNSDLSSDIYTLTGGKTYTVGSDTALVFRNGVCLKIGVDYQETNSTSITIIDYTPDSADLYTLRNFEQSAGFFQQEFANSDLSSDIYTLTGGESYSIGVNDIAVFRNGVLLTVDEDYTETNSTSITMIDYTANVADTYMIRKF